MKVQLILLLLGINTIAHGQATKNGQQRVSPYSIQVSAMPQWYLNGINVENDGIEPEAISTKNTGGYTLGLAVERKGRRGLILNLGLEYGLQHHNVAMGYEDLVFFDSSMITELKKLGRYKNIYTANTTYYNIRLMVGYVLPYKILGDYTVELKAGLNSRCYISGFAADTALELQVITSQSINHYPLTNWNIYLGSPSERFSSWQKDGVFNVSLNRNLTCHYLKYINIGLEITKGFVFKNQDYGSGRGTVESFSVNSVKSSNGRFMPSSTDRYRVKDFSFGLRLTAGLWHR